MMTLQLVKKDALLIKRMWPGVVAVAFAVPLIIHFGVGTGGGTVAFLCSASATMFVTFQLLVQLEQRNGRATAMLCTTPYSRAAIVRAKYLGLLLPFAIALLAQALLSFLVPGLLPPTLAGIAGALALNSALYSLLIAFMYKLGVEKMMYAMAACVIFASLILPRLITSFGPGIGSMLAGIPPAVILAVLLAVSLALLAGSVIYSTRAFQMQELQ